MEQRIKKVGPCSTTAMRSNRSNGAW